MDYTVTWSPEALDDVESIARYIERDSTFYAKAVVTKIVELSRSLVSLPKRGRIVPELEDHNIRELFVYSYRLIYQIRKDSTYHCCGA
ncbi:MAG: type II toxin-antitoxin system RelE/ParE family toxin [Thiohalomonadales bacterium]